MNRPFLVDPDVQFINRGVGVTQDDVNLLLAEKDLVILGLKKELEQVKQDYVTLARRARAEKLDLEV